MHLALYGRTDARAIVHTHSTSATVLSTLLDEVPPIHYLIALFGGPVRVAPYATYGTPELATAMLGALEGRTACLLGNHGAVTYAATLAAAYTQAVYLEWICEVYLRASHGGRIAPSAPARGDRARTARTRLVRAGVTPRIPPLRGARRGGLSHYLVTHCRPNCPRARRNTIDLAREGAVTHSGVPASRLETQPPRHPT